MSSELPDSAVSDTSSTGPPTDNDSTPSDATPAAKASLCSLLADETRMRILQALYAVSLDSSTPDGLSFSALRRRAAVEDSGRFNYHLDQLTADLVTKREGRYALTSTGKRLVQALGEPTEGR